jgi:hypothetical protein
MKRTEINAIELLLFRLPVELKTARIKFLGSILRWAIHDVSGATPHLIDRPEQCDIFNVRIGLFTKNILKDSEASKMSIVDKMTLLLVSD